MEINVCNLKTKCEINGCKNLAEYSVFKQNDKKAGINICKTCATNLYDCLSKICIPKSIPAPFKNQKRIRVNK